MNPKTIINSQGFQKGFDKAFDLSGHSEVRKLVKEMQDSQSFSSYFFAPFLDIWVAIEQFEQENVQLIKEKTGEGAARGRLYWSSNSDSKYQLQWTPPTPKPSPKIRRGFSRRRRKNLKDGRARTGSSSFLGRFFYKA